MMFSNSSKKIIFIEIAGFLTVVLFLWLDEILDIPHILFGCPKTSVNLPESAFETGVIIILAIFIIYVTIRLLMQNKYLKGLFIVCTHCNMVKARGDWERFDIFVSDHSDAEFSHGLCPACIEKHYAKVLGPEKLEKVLNKVNNYKE